MALIETGVNPEALAAVVKELRRETAELKVGARVCPLSSCVVLTAVCVNGVNVRSRRCVSGFLPAVRERRRIKTRHEIVMWWHGCGS